ncbi:MAG: TolB family protein [Methanococcaceae archaeon]
MRPYISFSLLIFFLFVINTGCLKLDTQDNQDNFGLIKNTSISADSKSRIIATRKNASVEITLYYYDFQPWDKLNISSQSYPDYYEIYLSPDGTHWELIRDIDTSFINKSFIISDLQNDELYYMYLKEIRDDGKTFKNTNVVIFVPSAFSPTYSFIMEDYFGHDIYSFDNNIKSESIVYGTKYYEYDQSHASPAIFEIGSDNKATPVDLNCWFPDFNPDGTKIAYSSNKGEKFDGNILPEHISVYDVKTRQSVRFTSGYSVNKFPVWSPVNSILAYSSSGESDNDLKIKVFDPKSNETKVLEDHFEANPGIVKYSQEKPCWSFDEKYIYYTHRYFTEENSNPGFYDIYRIRSNGGTPEAVFNSNWIECTPSMSPDNSKIAFLTDLNGKLQIWIYDLIKGKFQQPFDSNDYYFSEIWSQIRWRDDKNLLFTAFSEEHGGDSSIFLITVK